MLQKKGTKVAIGIVGGLVIGIITVIAIAFIFLLFFFFGGPPKTTKNVAKYQQTMEENMTREYGKARTEFLTFPKEIPDSAFEQDTKPEFYNYFQDTWDDPTYEVYLKCKYSDEDYQSEIDRLSNVTYETDKRLILDYYDRFNYPAYIAINHNDYSYEYALDLGDNSIAYIYVAWKSKIKELKKIPLAYLPSDYEESLTSEEGSYFNLNDPESTAYNIYRPAYNNGYYTLHGISAYKKDDVETKFNKEEMIVFPSDMPDHEGGSYIYREYKDFKLVILENTMSEEEYEAEETRLKEAGLNYDTSTYEFPAYVSGNDEDYYEYALLDEANSKIMYVALQNPKRGYMQQYSEYIAIDKSIYNY